MHPSFLLKIVNKLRVFIFAFCVCALLIAAAACKRKEPSYVLKPEAGEADISQFDLQEDLPKTLRVRSAERQVLLNAEARKREREKISARYHGR